MRICSAVPRTHVSIHAPARARRFGCPSRHPRRAVSIHAPARARHVRVPPQMLAVDVSIHAPARARPLTCRLFLFHLDVFQSTRPRGRDAPHSITGTSSQMFQSTRPRGRDPASVDAAGDVDVSIHAPARARRCMTASHTPCACFNPRAREGATGFTATGRRHFFKFQSTRPRGRDPARRRSIRSRPRFNPRAREGATDSYEEAKAAFEVSIHAPARARHAPPNQVPAPGRVSIHAPARARPPRRRFRKAGRRFNPRAREGAT